MLEAAIYFQQREDTIDKAVLLYHRAGNLAKAIELVFTHRRFGALENLVEELDRDTDVNVLSRCADLFSENNCHAKAVHLFLLSKDYVKALKMIVDYNVELTLTMIPRYRSLTRQNHGGRRPTLLRSDPIPRSGAALSACWFKTGCDEVPGTFG